MIIKCQVKLQVLAKSSNEYQGNKYYKLTVFNGDPTSPEAGSLKCSEECFNTVQIGSINLLNCEVNDDKGYIRAVSVEKVGK